MFINEMIKNSETDADMAKVFLTLCLKGELDVDNLKKMLNAIGFELKPIAESILRNKTIIA